MVIYILSYSIIVRMMAKRQFTLFQNAAGFIFTWGCSSMICAVLNEAKVDPVIPAFIVPVGLCVGMMFLMMTFLPKVPDTLVVTKPAEKTTGWRSIRDDQPPQHTEVLVYDRNQKAVMIAILDVYTWRPTDRLGQPCQIGSHIITHWMPMPPAP